MKNFWKILMIFTLLFLPFNQGFYKIVSAASPGPGSVVINEAAWMGTVSSANDEWIELYNTTNQEINLTNWLIDDDDSASIYTILGGVIPAHGYFVIEDSEETISSKAADAVINLSLSNTGDKLILKDETGATVDSLNLTGGAWYAGDSTNKISMERIDAGVIDDLAGNWSNNTGGNGQLDRDGNPILGTPGGLNSVSQPPQLNPIITLEPSNAAPNQGEQISVMVNAADVNDLFAYGFDLTYDPFVLDFNSALKGAFLSENNTIQTAFEAALQDGNEGRLIAGEARTNGQIAGVTGNGELFSIIFNVIGAPGSQTAISIQPSSFLADSNGDLISEFNDTNINVNIQVVNPVQGLQSMEGANRYEIKLDWTTPVDGADNYKILRKDVFGNYAELGTTAELTFIDKDGVNNGGNIIPNFSYEYSVVALIDAVQSVGVEINGTETRGIKGDNNRSDRVDGRDLENLARHFAEDINDPGFNALTDTTYDGNVDGNDLLDIGANFGLTYN